jgi:hypothetical protein
MAQRKRRGPPPPGDQRPGIFDNRTRLLALGMVLFAVVLLVWARRPDPATDAKGSATSEEEPSQSGSSGGSSPFAMGVSPAPSAPQPAGSADPPPVIDEIVLEKKEVCAGEENLVTVKSHTTNGTDPFLHTLIDGHQGSSFPVTLWRDDNGAVLGNHSVTVFGRGNVATTVPLPMYEVKDCRPTYIAELVQRVRSNTWSDFEFNARVVGIPRAPTDADRQRGAPPPPVPKPFKAVSWSWDFGDGSSTTTLTPIVEHDYEGRAQTSLYSYYVVGVTIRGAKGEVATGRSTLSLINPAFEALAEKGIVALMISLDPRFPEIGTDGKVTQKVRLWHTSPQAVTIEHAMVTRYYKQAAGQTPPSEVDVASVLGTTIIPSGKDGITTTVVLDPQSEDEVFSKTWDLKGVSADDLPVLGSFSVMLPPAKPGPDAGSTVFDPLLKQKIILAREILGKDVVNDEDLWRLQREGMFADLKVSPAEAAAAASAAIAEAIQKGPPSAQRGPVVQGPAAPTSTNEQRAQPQAPSTPPNTNK